MADKGDFKDFMSKEIDEQNNTTKKCINEYLDKSRDEIALEVDEDVKSFKDAYLNHLVTWYESAERNPEAIFSKPFAEDLSICISIADSMSKSN